MSSPALSLEATTIQIAQGLLDVFDSRHQLIVYRAFFEPGVFGWQTMPAAVAPWVGAGSGDRAARDYGTVISEFPYGNGRWHA